jgi:amidohydrolase
LGGDFDLTFEEGYAATYNDPEITGVIEEAVTDLFGKEQLASPEPGMGAEDFGYMTRIAPGAMFFLGAKRDEVDRPHHSPIFDIDESNLYIGAALLAETACRLLRNGHRPDLL